MLSIFDKFVVIFAYLKGIITNFFHHFALLSILFKVLVLLLQYCKILYVGRLQKLLNIFYNRLYKFCFRFDIFQFLNIFSSNFAKTIENHILIHES